MVTSNVTAWPGDPGTDWRAQGECVHAGVDPDMFFPVNDDDPAAIAAAKDICVDCPVLDQCRAHALANGEQFGIWGGLSTAERREISARSVRGHSPPAQPSHGAVTALPISPVPQAAAS